MSVLSRLLNVVRRDWVDRDLDEELRFHLEARIEALRRQGWSLDEARAEARRQFGNPLVLREASHDIKVAWRAESILRDVGFGLRLCRRHTLVTAAAVVSLALAIGACTAAFSLIDALILRPLPVEEPGSVVYLGLRAPADPRDGLSFNYPLFREMRAAGAPYVRLFAMGDQRRRDARFDGGRRRRLHAVVPAGVSRVLPYHAHPAGS